MKGKQGQALMIGLLMLIFTLMILVTIMPVLNQILSQAQNSQNLNCAGYNDTTTAGKSYNSSLPTNDIACLAIKLYMPYLVLAILLGSISRLIYRKRGGEAGYDLMESY
tara:strand:- start:231 stop:557 length:327 start_codon:yes stop_codon:yes gene_type:complete